MPTFSSTIMYLPSGAHGAQPASVAATTTELPDKWRRAGLALKQNLQEIAALRSVTKQTQAMADLDSSQTRYVPKFRWVLYEVA